MPAGTVAIRQGDPPQQVLWLESGQALMRRSETTGVDVAIAVCQARAFLGLGATVRQVPHPASAVLLTDATVIALPASRFLDGLSAAHIGAAISEQLASEHLALIER